MCSCNVFVVILLWILINITTGDENGVTYHRINGPFDFDSGGNWCKDAERLEQYFAANGIQGDTKKFCFTVHVGKKRYELVHNLLTPAKLASKKYQDSGHNDRTFTAKTFYNAEHFKFHKKNQGSSETVSRYLAEL